MLIIIVTIIMTNVNCASSTVLTMIPRMKAWCSRWIARTFQVTGYTATTNKSCEIRQIELAKRRAELKASFELAEAREARARAKAQTKAEKAEMLAKLRVEEARIEAEEKLIACSKRGFVASSRRSQTKSLHISTSSSTTTRGGRSEFGTDAGVRKTSNSKTLKTKQAESKSSLISHLS